MADETNVENTETPVVNYEELYKETVEKHTTLETNYKQLQRNLDQRDKGASADVSKLTAELARQSQLLSVLVDSTDLVDEEVRTDLKKRDAETARLQAEAQSTAQLLETVKENLRDAGVKDTTDPRYEEINELWVDGEHKEALRVARRMAREHKVAAAVPPVETVSEEDRIKAGIDKGLRAAGIRTVDAHYSDSSVLPTFTQDNLKARLAAMTPAEFKAARQQILQDMK